ncbi:hypothetical protein SAY87_008871 [Trapa incisa]|uniref:RING-type domain-containing protein n=1 Tax=Trapa incisa TaxID=236973 RepID=A0AAN7JYN1_9MYRT|nr:hypothetical protein SAY87_008871 [Trapa incisa]
MGNKSSRNRGRSNNYDQHNYDTRFVRRSSYTPHGSFSASLRQDDWERRSMVHLRYSRIEDEYYSLDQVTAALAEAGLESSNLIVGIDFTKSNEWTGSRSFQRKCLHHLGHGQNPYEQAISIIGRTLSSFDEDNLIPCFGFGDATTHDRDVFSFYPDNRSCNGFEEVLARYRELVPQVKLAGPTSFAPIIETALDIVEKSGGQYHILMIIADGQVTRSVDMAPGQLSPQEQNTIDAIVKASEYPLSIVLVGVGDGPWDMMRKFDDNIPARAFDNFQFVNFTQIMQKNTPWSKKEADFALAALMEIPAQYKATLCLQLIGHSRGSMERYPLLPPERINSTTPSRKNMHPIRNETEEWEVPVGSFRSTYSNGDDAASMYSYLPPPVTEGYPQNKDCPVCLWSKKDLAFGCGHQTCFHCGIDLTLCPICRTCITTRIKLYD